MSWYESDLSSNRGGGGVGGGVKFEFLEICFRFFKL
jgi:hypothetical protein